MTRGWWFGFPKWKDITEIHRWMCTSPGAACVWKTVVVDWFMCIEQTGSKWQICQDRDRLIFLLIWRTLHESGMLCMRTNVGSLFPLSVELNMSIGTVHAVVWDQTSQSVLPVGPISSDTHTHRVKRHCVTVLLEHLHWYHTECYMLDCGSRWWDMLSLFWTHSDPTGNQQACSRDPHLHPSWRNSSLMHPLVKWCWLFSLT